MPSSLHSRGLFAGAGSAASLIAAAFVSLLVATGFVAFTSWPAAGGSSVPSVNLPSVPTAGVPTGAAGRAFAAVFGGRPIALPAAGAPARRGTGRTIARTGGRGGSPAPVVAGPAPATAATGGSSTPGGTAPAGVARQVTDGVADTTSTTTQQVGSAVGGPAGDAIEATGDQVAQTIRDVGTTVQPLLGGLGG